jgi:RNA polymerase sigma factor (sigma-70 family)
MTSLPGDARTGDLTSGSPRFTTTHWSVVLEAAHPDSPGGMEAFAQLYRDYWYPLYAYVRRRGHTQHEAEDLVQDFFLALLERQRLRDLERSGGRFRSFLLKALQNFLANAWDHTSAQKRGGGLPTLALDDMDAETRFLADPSTSAPESEFERNWAFTVIARAMQTLESELRAGGKENLFQLLRPHLQGERNGRPYAAIAPDLGMTEGAVKVAVHRLRQRYGELLRAEVGRTVDDEAELAEEVRHLISIVSA